MVEQVLLLQCGRAGSLAVHQSPGTAAGTVFQSTCLDGIYHRNDLIKDCSVLCRESFRSQGIPMNHAVKMFCIWSCVLHLCLISRMTSRHCRSSICCVSTHIISRQPLFFKELGDFLENILSFGRSFQCMEKQELFFEVSILDVPNKYKKLDTPC